MPQSALLDVTPTKDRKPGLYYGVQVNRETADRLKLRKWAVAAFAHPAFAFNERLTDRTLPFIAIHCRVDVVDSISDGVAAVDQTLRNAMGIPVPVFRALKGVRIFLLPASRSSWHLVRTAAASLFGLRYMALRAKVAEVADMEKNYVRIQNSALRSLGVLEADDVMIERPFAVFDTERRITKFKIAFFRASAFLASDKVVEDRCSMEVAFPQRYFNGALALYDCDPFVDAGYLSLKHKPAPPEGHERTVEPDIPAIFMDYDTRNLGLKEHPGNVRVDFVTPVMVRRSVSSAIARESLQTGMTFGIALINIMLAVAQIDAAGTRQWIPTALGASALITVGLLMFRLRQEV